MMVNILVSHLVSAWSIFSYHLSDERGHIYPSYEAWQTDLLHEVAGLQMLYLSKLLAPRITGVESGGEDGRESESGGEEREKSEVLSNCELIRV